eukprot:2052114-Amphidinium_carterae.1
MPTNRPSGQSIVNLISFSPLLSVGTGMLLVPVPGIRGHAQTCASWVRASAMGQMFVSERFMDFLDFLLKGYVNAATAALGKWEVLLQPGAPGCLNAFTKRTVNLQQTRQPDCSPQETSPLYPLAKHCKRYQNGTFIIVQLSFGGWRLEARA